MLRYKITSLMDVLDALDAVEHYFRDKGPAYFMDYDARGLIKMVVHNHIDPIIEVVEAYTLD